MKRFEYIALFLMTGFLLMIAALYNGYPIVDEDTTAFIEQAAYPHFSPDRTPFYGIFIKVASLGWSVWFPVVAQALLMSALLCRYVYLFVARPAQGLPFSTWLWIMLAIVALTGVSWTVSQLMADSFAAILLLCVLLIYCDDTAKWPLIFLYTACAFLAIAMHFSHFAVAGICGLVTGIVGYRRKNRLLIRRSVWLLSACGAFWLVMCSANAAKHHGFVFARGGNVFLVGKLAETGILEEYLHDKCGETSLRMCDPAQKIPRSLREFLGSGESPLYRLGGWDSGRAEYSSVVTGVFTSPGYAVMFARKAGVSALKQLVFVTPPAAFPAYGKESEPYKKVKSYYTDESREYVTSQQQQGLLSASVYRVVYLLVLLLSSLWVWMLPRGAVRSRWAVVYGLIFLFVAANAITVGVFGSVSPRFQYRIAWVLPATNLLLLFAHYRGAEFRITLKAREA